MTYFHALIYLQLLLANVTVKNSFMYNITQGNQLAVFLNFDAAVVLGLSVLQLTHHTLCGFYSMCFCALWSCPANRE